MRSNKILIIAFIISLILNIFLYTNYKNKEDLKPDIKIERVTDTITLVKDTIVYKTKILYKTEFDTIFVKDSDSIKVSIPIEHKQYSDTINNDSLKTCITINYSGFKASIDSINLINEYKNTYITEYVKIPNKKWNIGLQIGPSMGYDFYNKSPYIGIGIGIGINYNFIK